MSFISSYIAQPSSPVVVVSGAFHIVPFTNVVKNSLDEWQTTGDGNLVIIPPAEGHLPRYFFKVMVKAESPTTPWSGTVFRVQVNPGVQGITQQAWRKFWGSDPEHITISGVLVDVGVSAAIELYHNTGTSGVDTITVSTESEVLCYDIS